MPARSEPSGDNAAGQKFGGTPDQVPGGVSDGGPDRSVGCSALDRHRIQRIGRLVAAGVVHTRAVGRHNRLPVERPFGQRRLPPAIRFHPPHAPAAVAVGNEDDAAPVRSGHSVAIEARRCRQLPQVASVGPNHPDVAVAAHVGGMKDAAVRRPPDAPARNAIRHRRDPAEAAELCGWTDPEGSPPLRAECREGAPVGREAHTMVPGDVLCDSSRRAVREGDFPELRGVGGTAIRGGHDERAAVSLPGE